MKTEFGDSISMCLIKYLTLQLEYSLLEKRAFTFFETKDKSEIVELESIYLDAHEIEHRASKSIMSNGFKLAQKAKVIKDIIREYYCEGQTCYFNF